jgi:hypothetical protein
MNSVATIHVPVSNPVGPVNFSVAVDHGVWGWKEDTLCGELAFAAIRGLAVGQPLLLVLGGPNPRVPKWSMQGTFKAVAACTVTKGLYGSNDMLWPDVLYPIRVDFKVERLGREVALATLGTELCEAVRRSACTRGVPQLAKVELSGVQYEELQTRM